jgi:hypothetical protein
MSDDPVLDALRELPRERAAEGFTAAVLSAAPGAATEHAGWPRPLVALAALGLVLSGLGAWSWERAQRREELRGRVQALRQEQRELEQALRELRQVSAEEPRLLYLGGNERVDYVLDLDRFDRLDTPGPRPASVTVPQ